MLPKHLIPTSPGPDCEMSMHMSSEADDDDDECAGGIDGSPCMWMSFVLPLTVQSWSHQAILIAQDPDLSIRSREEDDLPPLERARRRRSILPGGQTRLVS